MGRRHRKKRVKKKTKKPKNIMELTPKQQKELEKEAWERGYKEWHIEGENVRSDPRNQIIEEKVTKEGLESIYGDELHQEAKYGKSARAAEEITRREIKKEKKEKESQK